MDIEDRFEKISANSHEYLRFELVENKRSLRRDMHAFLLLEELVPGEGRGIVAAAEHDQIWLDIDLDGLATVITDDQILELIRCGVFIDEGSLSMFR